MTRQGEIVARTFLAEQNASSGGIPEVIVIMAYYVARSATPNCIR